MLSNVRLAWKVIGAAGAALFGVGVGGAVYDTRKAAKAEAAGYIDPDDEFEEDDDEDVVDAETEAE